MLLTDLNPRFFNAGGEGITRNGKPVPSRQGVGMMFTCPCGTCDEYNARVVIMFSNPVDGGSPVEDRTRPLWKRIGEDFETMTIEPSILRTSGCKWHGWIRNGEVLTCS